MKKYNRTLLLTLFLPIFLFALIAPDDANAASIFIKKPLESVRVGDTVLLPVMINTDQEINAIEGALDLDGPFNVASINTGGSVISLWPKTPTLAGKEISFAGGTPSGVYGNALRLFTIAARPFAIGIIHIKVKEAAAYLADGKGTKIPIAANDYEIDVIKSDGGAAVKNDLASLVKKDKNPPAPFAIDLGRDAALYNNKYFVSFYASDAESGVKGYEVREGNFPSVSSGNTYVLRDQSLSSAIEVTAIDNAGNVRTETLYPQKTSGFKTLLVVALSLIGIAFASWILYRFRQRLFR
ncbi:MAG: hypothetical protein HY220_04480 [Candidatus Sungbacteria bacterium]|uniref:Cohesin domain-containing protein n=1 Tax=Candidatus Sungiibacteriota bacterium TaxID=2750080 RepID=A0A9D6LRZ4_9BACT|nr:hypothetical protein [Candidatus Sungbacteria bacterium]